VLRRWREQPVPLARDRLAWISGDRERPHPEWSRRAAAGTTSGRAAGADPAAAHTTVGSVRSSRLALAENQRTGSPYFGRIDPALVAYSGWSCGGLQALQVAKDPRVKTLVLHNTGVLNDGPGAIPGIDVRKDVLQSLHTPAIYILGGPKDIAYPNGMDDFKRIAHVPVAVANLQVGHGGTFNEPNGGAAASVAVSWLDWQLRGDAQSGKRFIGDDCGLCKESQWSLERKQFPGP
jgi:hypothetical protein